MTAIPNSTTISAPIAPSDTGDQYPTHYARYGNGGMMAAANEAAREAIPASRREEGMWVQQLDDGSFWRLMGGITNGDWEEVTMTMANIEGLVAALIGKEPALGNPTTNGYCLLSTTDGTRYWGVLPGSSNSMDSELYDPDEIRGDVFDPYNMKTTANYRFVTDTEKGNWNKVLYLDEANSGMISVDISGGNVVLNETDPFAGIVFIGGGTPGPILVTVNDSLFGKLPMGVMLRNNSAETVHIAWESNPGSYIELKTGWIVFGAFIQIGANKYTSNMFLNLLNDDDLLSIDATKRDKAPSIGTLTISSGEVAIDVGNALELYTLDVSENITTWTFTNLPAAGTFKDIEIDIKQDASLAKTVVSPASAGKTAGGTWTMSTTLSSLETLGLRVFSDGSIYLYPSGVMA